MTHAPGASMKHRIVCILLLLRAAGLFAAPPALVPLPQLMQTNAGTFTVCPPR